MRRYVRKVDCRAWEREFETSSDEAQSMCGAILSEGDKSECARREGRVRVSTL